MSRSSAICTCSSGFSGAGNLEAAVPVSSVVGAGNVRGRLDMAERGPRGRWSLRSKTMVPLSVGAIGAVVVGLVWITGGDGSASGQAGGGANADAPAGPVRGRRRLLLCAWGYSPV
jgi:hypothetical protein